MKAPGRRDRTEGRVALVHDFLLDVRGAERVFLAMCELWPDADIYTPVYDERGDRGPLRRRGVHTSFLQRLRPSARTFRALLPFYPLRSSRSTSRATTSWSRARARGRTPWSATRARRARVVLPQPVPLRSGTTANARSPSATRSRARAAPTCSAAGASGTGSPPSGWTATSPTRAPRRTASAPTSAASRR